MTRAARLEDVLELKRRVVGVRLLAREARRKRGVNRGAIVYGFGGLDEGEG